MTKAEKMVIFATAHSCGLRLVGVIWRFFKCALPQRIRAGCDCGRQVKAWAKLLCHSAFVRVATRVTVLHRKAGFFATAHSCGLRRDTTASLQIFGLFATAHSCGLRPVTLLAASNAASLPQRIRAGCDEHKQCCREQILLCHSAFVRVATVS